VHFISRLPFPVLGIDETGTILESNGALERELGLGHSLQGKSIASSLSDGSDDAIELIHGDRANENPVVQLAFAGAPSRPRTFYVIVDGDTRWLIGQPREFDEQRDAVRRAHERAEAQTDEYARISQELLAANEQLAQRARALMEAGEAKARFLATMSHELRTPLNAVLGYAGLVRDGVYGTVSVQQERAVQAIVRRAKDLQLLIDDVLDLSKIESGRAELHDDEFEPSAVLEEVKDAIAAFARDKKLQVSVRTRIKRRVRLDRGKYKQVLLNLASNAVKFTPEGGEVELSVEEGDGHSMITHVRDSGIGIAPENLGVIFDDFQQVESGTTRRYQGIGLGLAIVKHTVELLGGTVSVKSEPARGTTFSLRFPIQAVGEALLGDSGAVPDDAALSNDPIIVAIDDDPEVISLLRDSLAPAHFRVVGALNGDRGMELARIVKPFAITLDIMMPEKDGWQVLREVKADPELCRIPVIVMSIVSERSLGFSLGASDYLVKPVDRHVLIDALERWCTRGASTRSPSSTTYAVR
jgi:signal transduction histidine kinase/CheY-like chemotaxis protein